MDLKRTVTAVAFISFSLFLIYPKENLVFLNLWKSFLSVFFTLISVGLIGYGLLLFRDVYEKNEAEENESRNLSNQADGFEKSEEWRSKGNWLSQGCDVWQGEIQEDGFKMSDGVDSSHYAKKFSSMDFERMGINLEIPDPDGTDAFLEIATGDSLEGLKKLKEEKFDESKRIKLSSGFQKIDLDMDWGEFTFFKIVLHKEVEGADSPIVKNIVTEGRRQDDEDGEEVDRGEEGNRDNEEMPSFEDVEYKDLECPECGEDFKTDIGLKVHRKVNHPDEFEES